MKPSPFSGITKSERATMPKPLRCTRSSFPSFCTSATLSSTSGTIYRRSTRSRGGRASASSGPGIADVQLYALRGERQKALSALRQAIDEGWRRDWWYQLQYQPDLEPLDDEPEFQAMLDEIRADMATQLGRVREIQRRGELAFPAALPGPSLSSVAKPPHEAPSKPSSGATDKRPTISPDRKVLKLLRKTHNDSGFDSRRLHQNIHDFNAAWTQIEVLEPVIFGRRVATTARSSQRGNAPLSDDRRGPGCLVSPRPRLPVA